MNTHGFHAQATRLPAEAPTVTGAELATMSEVAHAAHVQHVSQWVAGTYLHTSQTDALKTALDVAVNYNEATLAGSKTIMGLSGTNGAGKSTLVHQWSAQYYRRAVQDCDNEGRLPRWSPEPGVLADVAPVVWINLQANAKIAEVDAQILTFLRVGTTGTIREMTLRTVRALERHRVRTLIIDDVHLLDTRLRAGRGVLDHIKHINTEIGEFGGTLFLVGADLHRTELCRDPQIINRLRLLTLPTFATESVEQRQTWTQLLAELEPQLMPALPAASPGYLSTTLARPLAIRSAGRLGELVNVLKQATIAATISRLGTITAEVLRAVPASYRSPYSNDD